jgi:hypothetical protein
VQVLVTALTPGSLYVTYAVVPAHTIAPNGTFSEAEKQRILAVVDDVDAIVLQGFGTYAVVDSAVPKKRRRGKR